MFANRNDCFYCYITLTAEKVEKKNCQNNWWNVLFAFDQWKSVQLGAPVHLVKCTDQIWTLEHMVHTARGNHSTGSVCSLPPVMPPASGYWSQDLAAVWQQHQQPQQHDTTVTPLKKITQISHVHTSVKQCHVTLHNLACSSVCSRPAA